MTNYVCENKIPLNILISILKGEGFFSKALKIN